MSRVYVGLAAIFTILTLYDPAMKQLESWVPLAPPTLRYVVWGLVAVFCAPAFWWVASRVWRRIGGGRAVRFLWSSTRSAAARITKLRTGVAAAWDTFKRIVWPPPTAEPSEDIGSGAGRWEVIEHTLRRIGIATGEAFPALIGMAKAKELGDRNRYLYMCVFLHADSHHMELRVQATGEQVRRRFAEVKVQGEVLSDMIFHPCVTPVVSDTRMKEGINVGAAHLLDNGDGFLTVSVRDIVVDGPSVRERERDILRVPLRGFREASDMLENAARRVREVSPHDYSPPAFNRDLNAVTIDLGMRDIMDLESYETWRSEMATHFGR